MFPSGAGLANYDLSFKTLDMKGLVRCRGQVAHHREMWFSESVYYFSISDNYSCDELRAGRYVEQPVQFFTQVCLQEEVHREHSSSKGTHSLWPCSTAVPAQRKVLQQQLLQVVKLEEDRPLVAKTSF